MKLIIKFSHPGRKGPTPVPVFDNLPPMAHAARLVNQKQQDDQAKEQGMQSLFYGSRQNSREKAAYSRCPNMDKKR
jgi:hypothetical protein